ncbi:hypothetical protein THAOC_02587 [Thalassiosira oceanica]|uniref:DUF6820 domain-containing protein n=1 Tax=Thalassiosira oceanica TaxID=159749 RepID=K0TE98_THAOC|nr:hypothetical protein THAOC_02587 [Thalassiosira oceanica]|eukprot:EJK75685.1 hypothetical protein THAOC_02587 [Thalassiosira oceanica]
MALINEELAGTSATPTRDIVDSSSSRTAMIRTATNSGLVKLPVHRLLKGGSMALYGRQPSKKVLKKVAKKRKKDKYMEACQERRWDFIPMAYSVDVRAKAACVPPCQQMGPSLQQDGVICQDSDVPIHRAINLHASARQSVLSQKEQAPPDDGITVGQKQVWMVPDGHAALQGLKSIPHLTSVAAGIHGSDVINGSKTSAGRARAMMHKFAVVPVRLIDNVGRT